MIDAIEEFHIWPARTFSIASSHTILLCHATRGALRAWADDACDSLERTRSHRRGPAIYFGAAG